MSKADAVKHLQDQIELNQHVVSHFSSASSRVVGMLENLQHWQRERLDATYDDLRSDPRYRPACEFFLDDLYGGRDVHERDRQLERVVPVMRRFLPGYLLMAVGDAVRLQAISHEFDLELAELLVAAEVDEIDQAVYARVYRDHGEWTKRELQLDLIRKLGDLLGETVQKPMVHRLIRLMHGPAVMAGFGALQDFLRRGLDAFAEMGSADHFLDTIESRERSALEAIREGSDAPFERWIGAGPRLSVTR